MSIKQEPLSKREKEMCLLRWGAIPDEEEFVRTAMENWSEKDIPSGYVSQEEINRKENLRLHFQKAGIEYIYK